MSHTTVPLDNRKGKQSYFDIDMSSNNTYTSKIVT